MYVQKINFCNLPQNPRIKLFLSISDVSLAISPPQSPFANCGIYNTKCFMYIAECKVKAVCHFFQQ